MILTHYTGSPFKFSRERVYREDPGHFKPHGLWLSDCSENSGRSWKEFCEGDEWNLGNLAYVTKFKCDISSWIVLSNYEEICKFTKLYKKDIPGLPESDFKWIDWKLVRQDAKGILITPYCYVSRFEHMWYYGWDCASACVWDLSTIEPIVE